MLVLSRKENEKILFPHLGIALQILRNSAGKVRLGIEAPSSVSVVRWEIASQEQLVEFSQRLQQTTGSMTHEVRNRLHTTLLGLHVLQKQLAANLTEDAEVTLERLLSSMEGLDHECGARRKPSSDQPRRKALVVEDNSNEQQLLASYLSLAGYDVHTAADGLEALDYLASHERPDAVVMDMQLPRLGGAAAVSVLRSDPRFRGLKVYAVSGMDRTQVQLPEGPEGVDHWFTKPLDPGQLVERMNQELAGCAGAS
jgi:carbon storage regulator CsrA